MTTFWGLLLTHILSIEFQGWDSNLLLLIHESPDNNNWTKVKGSKLPFSFIFFLRYVVQNGDFCFGGLITLTLFCCESFAIKTSRKTHFKKGLCSKLWWSCEKYAVIGWVFSTSKDSQNWVSSNPSN